MSDPAIVRAWPPLLLLDEESLDSLLLWTRNSSGVEEDATERAFEPGYFNVVGTAKM